MAAEYQVLARRYRPQLFRDVLGQESIVITLRNMIRLNRTAHAYLFSGAKGTGKTTLARLFAKALNCRALTKEGEPCNSCLSCREILSGNSLDILEIDGASHRGIEDIRKINDTVGYATSSGGYKIYIIDEVHMLTKEAFNALLKTLEEPPPSVKFFFATTEAHKVLPTILSRCQRFNLSRIAPEVIAQKLRTIATDLHVHVEDEALRLIATMADGGLRDAESLFDQVLAFHEGVITADTVAAVLGVMLREVYFQLDAAGARGELAYAFTLSQQLFAQGKDLLHFVEGLLSHLRDLLVTKLTGKDHPNLLASPADRERFEQSSAYYSQPQLLDLIDYLVEAQARMRFAPSMRMAIEGILLHVIRSHKRVPIERLVRRLADLEQAMTLVKQEPTVAVIHPAVPLGRMNEDPTPRPEDLGQPKQQIEEPFQRQNRQDTLLQFCAVEFQGTLEKHR